MLLLISIIAAFFGQNHMTMAHIDQNYTRVRRQTVANGCYLPPHPKNGEWTVYDTNSRLLPGRLIKVGTILKIRCLQNYKLDGSEFATCIDREWRPYIGRCLQTCPTISNTFTMTVSCTYNEKLANCASALEGTIARFQCSRFYEDRRLESHPFRICSNASWGSLPECVPVCGKQANEEPTLIVGGIKAERGDYPWQIALYTTTDQILICGGTLLNQRVIITAAHCVTDLDGELLPKDQYLVAAGKYYRNFNDSRDANDTQFSNISEIFTPKQYRGDLQNYLGDLAMLVTEKPFTLSNKVQPVCMDWGFTHYNSLINTRKLEYGYVAGWGFTVEYKNPSSVLKVLQVPLITDHECSQKLSEDDKKFLTDDKLCAGFINSSTAVCKGDSGGGLVYESGGRFYIMAVVSLSPQAKTSTGGCDSQQYTLYTNISNYAESFILDKTTKYSNSIDCTEDSACKTTTETYIKDPNCVLSPQPNFGRWDFTGSEDFFPGMSVVPGTTLHISCKKGYKLDSNETSVCDNGKWSSEIGHCLKICPLIKGSKNMNVTCVHNNKEENCDEAIDGTVANFHCSPFYEDLTLKTRPFRVCREGSWDQTLPKCQLLCGQKSINGSNLESENYPWHVGIYSKQDKELICGGSLLRENIVLTAAHCIANATGNLFPKEDYVVAVGKQYKLFNDSRDISGAQFSEVQHMVVSSDFHITKNHYVGDIATLILQKPFTLSETVIPVCLDWGETAVSANRDFDSKVGEVPGWRPSNSSEVLKGIKLSAGECEKDETTLKVYAMQNYDQRCASTIDKSPSVCKGDGGSGLVYEHNSKYYIRGVLSVPTGLQLSNNCDSSPHALYTRVFNYVNKLILVSFAKYKT